MKLEYGNSQRSESGCETVDEKEVVQRIKVY